MPVPPRPEPASQASGTPSEAQGILGLLFGPSCEHLWRTGKYKEACLKATVRPRPGLTPTSASTTLKGPIRPWTTGHRPRFITRNRFSQTNRGHGIRDDIDLLIHLGILPGLGNDGCSGRRNRVVVLHATAGHADSTDDLSCAVLEWQAAGESDQAIVGMLDVI